MKEFGMWVITVVEFRTSAMDNQLITVLATSQQSQELANSLNLELAWSRLTFDRPERSFLSNPFLLELIELDLGGWLDEIRRQIAVGYRPSACITVQAPKGNWQVRPGGHLRLEDEVVLNALVGRYLPNISQNLNDLQGDPDVAYQLPVGAQRREWVRRGFTVWKEWREKSKRRLEQGSRFVLFADISAFYENIDLSRLASDLRLLGVDEESGNLLSECLNRWAQPRGKGIPQGFSAVDILAKIYLASVDRNLRVEGFDHLRYVDDIRIFCDTQQEAKHALLKLSELLRTRGLNVQSAKTYIHSAEDALIEIDDVGPIISRIHHELLNEIRDGMLGGYGSIMDLERLVEENPDNPPAGVLERAFDEFFLTAIQARFHRSLFHFLLTRLGTVRSEIAIDYCLEMLRLRPEETDHILRYFEKVGLNHAHHEAIVDYLRGQDALYDYQNYLVLKFYLDTRNAHPGVTDICRTYVRDLTKPTWLRAQAAALIGIVGNPPDMEFFEANYQQCRDDVERATCICCSARMEVRRRNEFLGRARRDGALEDRACRWVRART